MVDIYWYIISVSVTNANDGALHAKLSAGPEQLLQLVWWRYKYIFLDSCWSQLQDNKADIGNQARINRISSIP